MDSDKVVLRQLKDTKAIKKIRENELTFGGRMGCESLTFAGNFISRSEAKEKIETSYTQETPITY